MPIPARIFISLSLASALVAFSMPSVPVVNGLGKALAGICFILFYITNTVGRLKA